MCLALLASGAAIVVYDLSRLARNARLMLDLQHELERRQVPLLVTNLPGAKADGATGRDLFGQLCLAAQLQCDLDSERMTGMQRWLFEDGRHRGHDPLGYRATRACGARRTSSGEPRFATTAARRWAVRARRCPADSAEGEVLARIARGMLPDVVIDKARTELRKRVETPEVAVAGRRRGVASGPDCSPASSS